MDAYSPDPDRFTPYAVLHEGKLRDVVLLGEMSTSQPCVGHRLKAPSNQTLDGPRLAALVQKLIELQHPRLPRFRECLSVRNDSWLLFEYVEGYPLSQLQDHTDTVSDDYVAFWLSQMLQVLEYVHSRSHVIGGFTPSDLIVNPTGLSLVEHGVLGCLFPESIALARNEAGRAMLAPEERHSARHTVAGDLFSAGAVAYWLACGHVPAGDQTGVQARVVELLAARPDFVPRVAETIARLLQFQPAQRGEGARQALEAMAWAVPPLLGDPPPPAAGTYKMRWLQAPAEVHETPSSPAPPVEADLVQPAAPSVQDVMREAADDLLWVLRRSPLMVVLVLIGVALLVAGGAQWLGGRPTGPAGLIVDSGAIQVNTQGAQWQAVSTVTQPGLIMASGPTVLSFGGGGRLTLRDGQTLLRLQQLTQDRMAMAMLDGHVTMAIPESMRVSLTVLGATLTCSPGTSLDLSLTGAGATLQVHDGGVNVSGMAVKAGQKVSFGGQL